MTFNLGISFAERRFCYIVILISIFGSGTLWAQSTSMQPGSLDPEGSSLCRLRVPDTIPQSPVNAEEATMTNGALAYTPLSARCKFSLFLSSTYSPYTLASAGFGATWAQATGQWPHTVEVCRVGKSDLARLSRIQNRGDSSRLLLCQRSCIRILAIFLRTGGHSSPGCGIPRREWWSPGMTGAITRSIHPSFWALC
jgi:hypothetical protein